MSEELSAGIAIHNDGVHVILVNANEHDIKTYETCCSVRKLPFVREIVPIKDAFTAQNKELLIDAFESDATIVIVFCDIVDGKPQAESKPQVEGGSIPKKRFTEVLARDHLETLIALSEMRGIPKLSDQLKELLSTDGSKNQRINQLVKACLLFVSQRHHVLVVENWTDTADNVELAKLFGRREIELLTITNSSSSSMTNSDGVSDLRDAILGCILPAILGVVKRNPRIRHRKSRSETWGTMNAPRLRHAIDSYVLKELEEEDAIREFNRIAKTINRDSKNRSQSSMALLAALIFARYLGRGNVEGHDFTTNVVMTNEDVYANMDLGRDVYQFGTPKTHFHFADHGIRNHFFELLLSESISLQVDLGSLECKSISQLTLEEYSESFSKELARGSSNQTSLGIAIRKKGYVEVYSGNKMVLWYDRFRWRAQPYRKMDHHLREFFGKARKPPDVLRRTISDLLDRQLSSIIAFVPAGLIDSVVNNENFVLKPIVEKLGDCSYASKETNKPKEQLALSDARLFDLNHQSVLAMARLDGILIIEKCDDNRFRIVRVMQRLDPKNTSLGNRSESSHAALLGTGGYAAELLAQGIHAPGFVIKVSASGEILVLPGKRVEKLKE